MKAGQLTHQEVSYLLPLLKAQIVRYSDNGQGNRYIKALEDLSNKIVLNSNHVFKTKERSFCNGCINEYLDKLKQELGSISVLTLLNLSGEKRQLMQGMDQAKDLLEKLGYYRKRSHFKHSPYYRYRTYLNAIDKLRSCHEIALYSPNEKDYSKIGFVTADAVHCYKLRDNFGFSDLDLHPFHKGVPEGYTQAHFKLVTSRSAAFKLLSEGNPDKGKTLDFVMAILKD